MEANDAVDFKYSSCVYDDRKKILLEYERQLLQISKSNNCNSMYYCYDDYSNLSGCTYSYTDYPNLGHYRKIGMWGLYADAMENKMLVYILTVLSAKM